MINNNRQKPTILEDSENLLSIESSPKCTINCPAGVNVAAYIHLMANGHHIEALDLIRENNPFPGICGRVCTRPCESSCIKAKNQSQINIRLLKHFAADFEMINSFTPIVEYKVAYLEKVAVIGSGPAGLTAAYQLVKLGYKVTVFEALEEAGGILFYGIPAFRLSKDILKREIDILRSSGVEIKTQRKIERPNELLTAGGGEFQIVIMACGAWQGLPLNILGEKLPGVLDGLSFLQDYNSSKIEKLAGQKVVVIGGGNSAIDAARAALRLGASKVCIAYRRTQDEMPALSEEIDEALEENIEILTLVMPLKILGSDKVEGIELLKTQLGDLDESGRRSPVPIQDSEFILECDWVIKAISFKPDLQDDHLPLTKYGTIEVDENFQTRSKNIWAIGDVVSGPSSIVEAIGHGSKCALSIHRHLRNNKKEIIEDKNWSLVVGKNLNTTTAAALPIELKEGPVQTEAQRCANCGPCQDCYTCFPSCDYRQTLVNIEGKHYLAKISKKESKDFPPLVPKISKERCVACDRCQTSCAYQAIRTEFRISGEAFSSVSSEVCRSCGRCALVCPTKALEFELYKGTSLINRIKKAIDQNGGIVVFGCYWDNPSEEYGEVINLLSLETITPLLLIESLSLGAKGILILRGEKAKRHYYPIEYDIEDIVHWTQNILKTLKIDPNYIKLSPSFTYFPNSFEPLTGLRKKIANSFLLRGLLLKARGLPHPLELIDSINELSKILSIKPKDEKELLTHFEERFPFNDLNIKDKEVAITQSSGMFFKRICKILNRVNGLSVTILPESSFFKAQVIIPTSFDSLCKLKLLNNKDGLHFASTQIIDFYSFLLDLLVSKDDDKENHRICTHPIVANKKDQEKIKFFFKGEKLSAFRGEMISSALFANGIKIFGVHHKDNSPQGIFCANGQCAQCLLLVNGRAQKSCITPLEEDGMMIEPLLGLPMLGADHEIHLKSKSSFPTCYKTQVLILGGGPAGLAAAIELGRAFKKVILADDKHILGGKLSLQTHNFFGSKKDCMAGMRGIDIGTTLANEVKSLPTVDIWTNSPVVGVFSDKRVGIVKDGKYVLVEPDVFLVASGAREKALSFLGADLPGVYGAGAFQTLVNRDLIKASKKLFILGGGNVGLIAAYHALQAGIDVVGLAEALPECGGYKVHLDKIKRLGVPVWTSHTVIRASGEDQLEKIIISKIDNNFIPIPGTEMEFEIDTLLVAVGLSPLNELFLSALKFNMKVYSAGDAHIIAEASAAIFGGKIVGRKILRDEGHQVEIPPSWEKMATLLKSKHSSKCKSLSLKTGNNQIYPVIRCQQEIPCNPCATSCLMQSITIPADKITDLPTFQGKCVGCFKCVSICPGLAITTVDQEFDPQKEKALAIIPYELSLSSIKIGDKVITTGLEGEVIGSGILKGLKISKSQDRRHLLYIETPFNDAPLVASIQIRKPHIRAMVVEQTLPPLKEDNKQIITCRCERVTKAEIEEKINEGCLDFNSLKAALRIGMGPCGGKTCLDLIWKIFNELGIENTKVKSHVLRPFEMEIPLKTFLN